MRNINCFPKIYDAIFYSETKLQESLIQNIINQYYSNKHILVIYRTGNYLIINDDKYYFNFHLRLNSIFSFLTFFRVANALKKIKTKEFVAAFFPGINARVLAKYLKHDIKCCVEDGVGTLQSVFFPETIISSIPLKPLNWIFNHGLKKAKDALDEIEVFYSIYGDIKNKNIDGRILTVDYFQKSYPKLSKMAFFVGQPLVMKNMISLYEYNGAVNSIAQQHDELKYIYHPIEKTEYNFCNKIKSLKFDQNFEESFDGLQEKPYVVYSYFSTVLINIKIKYPEICCYYIDSEVVKENVRFVLENFGVKKYDLLKTEL